MAVSFSNFWGSLLCTLVFHGHKKVGSFLTVWDSQEELHIMQWINQLGQNDSFQIDASIPHKLYADSKPSFNKYIQLWKKMKKYVYQRGQFSLRWWVFNKIELRIHNAIS
jgi:hypothetical protein